MKTLLSLFFVLILSGCSVFGDQLERAADKQADLAVWYCANFTLDQRQINRAAVEERLPPEHDADIDCPGDPED